jgi:hypothetical protein
MLSQTKELDMLAVHHRHDKHMYRGDLGPSVKEKEKKWWSLVMFNAVFMLKLLLWKEKMGKLFALIAWYVGGCIVGYWGVGPGR